MDLMGPIFYTNQFDESVQFYQALGLEAVDIDEGTFARLRFRNGNEMGVKASSGGRQQPGSQTMMVEVDDMQKAYEAAKSDELNIVRELTEEPWGTTFILADPDGNWIEFISGSNT